ncbi:hypothetical protein [Cellulomonas fimi]|uniref:Uncharacterized protein n=1 Tax=Cellulomonas fimi (strain ATCC 484 / DSM 20113 / JCM 1341 / CCUG 24087 / LMG 16345 / NBRC 15513 / NCIMB 8980 / NCTC 7547 / NRS-133) TaxID=590998 RepID=F4H149_CELFA|nr:hypothetical protein [Cellulomonas fimi]AEE47418.1 hypothetical protein Celf_3304 [Cellulomonas fimi ATCC 484]NNH05754.1 hypothetical protein [Cellulomonas fimi]VEH36160.1 Uncharacterised protein [Cellulomonas fimi]
MAVPPRLTAAQMFWWSTGLLLGSFVLSWLAGHPDALVRTQWLASVLVTLTSVGYTLGLTGVVGSFVVRALEPRGVRVPDAPRNVDREQNV